MFNTITLKMEQLISASSPSNLVVAVNSCEITLYSIYGDIPFILLLKFFIYLAPFIPRSIQYLFIPKGTYRYYNMCNCYLR